MAAQRRMRAVFMRGGTSKAIMFRREDLPADVAQWDPIFSAVMGSPDPFGRQLDGLGGGISSLSKVCVVGRSDRPDADVDFTFAQVAVDSAIVDYASNCGNMSSAVGPFAVDEGMVSLAVEDGPVTVRIFNTNTQRIILAHFAVEGSTARVDGPLAIAGVAGTGAPIEVEFLSPGGSKTGRLLPTGSSADVLPVEGFGMVDVSLVDAGNPCVFVSASALGVCGGESPDDLEARADFMGVTESIRRKAAVAMGLATDVGSAPLSIPKVAIVATSMETTTLSGATVPASDVDVVVRMMSMGRPHRAVPVTGALCLAAACRISGTIPGQLLNTAPTGPIRIGHPSGRVLADARMSYVDGSITVDSVSLHRTARRLFEGYVFVPQAPL
jgi:2-methylaconitate cis-trans-isomerase PrpF